YFAERQPRLEDWQALRSEVSKFKRRDELLVTAPDWATPLGRHAFGDELMPIADLARADDRGYQRPVEVGARGARSEELAGWRELERREVGAFTLRRLENPAYTPIKYRFVDHARPPDLAVSEGDQERDACPFSEHAPSLTGGLHGSVAFPR